MAFGKLQVGSDFGGGGEMTSPTRLTRQSVTDLRTRRMPASRVVAQRREREAAVPRVTAGRGLASESNPLGDAPMSAQDKILAAVKGWKDEVIAGIKGGKYKGGFAGALSKAYKQKHGG